MRRVMLGWVEAGMGGNSRNATALGHAQSGAALAEVCPPQPGTVTGLSLSQQTH